ncbi:SH3 domain-containing protein C23A1.17-like [Juglans microcarpa x Juglans regia]|uniref:SH3 domain-containing protein C23A1.17-like n=1 Tax=Juglans microcarpa x Juglans regia TaxID=2249226 RepID=UPI001B7EF312|nr:SH3 domain-containing protein C23A1.17-like [Juglans microcarpa x Juglans regia]
MADSSTPVNQPITVPSESTHANQPLQNQGSSPQLPPQNLIHQLSGAAESIQQLIASLPPEPNSALKLLSMASTQSNPSPPKHDASAIFNFRPELPSLSQPPAPGSLVEYLMMILNQSSSSQLAALNINNQLPSAGSESSIEQQIAWLLLPDHRNRLREFLAEVQLISQSQLPDSRSQPIPLVHEALLPRPAYNYYPDRVLPPAPAYGQTLNEDSNHERNAPGHFTIDIVEPVPLSQPYSSTVNAAPNYPPPPSVSPSVTQYQVSNPMVGAPSFGNLPNPVMTVVQPQILQDMKETQQSPVPPQPSAQPPPPPSPKHSPEHHQENPNPNPVPLPSPHEPVPAQTAPQRGPLITRPGFGKKNVAKTAQKASNLANLLPTGTVLAFQSLVPSLSNSGKCGIFHKYLIGFVIAVCAATCFLSSFTDSFEYNEKLYYGFATCNGLCVLNYENRAEEELNISKELKKYSIEFKDYIHAFGSLFVFLIFAISSSEVLSCFFPQAGENDKYSVVVYLPLVAGVLSSFLFSICPTKRKGFGYSEQGPRRQ